MKQTGATFILIGVCLTLAVNVVGVALPFWYSKEHGQNVNGTDERNACEIKVKIREGLWQRYCYEVRGAECIEDVEEWCEDLDPPEFGKYVIVVELIGDLFLIFVLLVILRSKCSPSREFFNMEMVGAKIGLAGLLMVIGVVVYIAADSGEIGYAVKDLHVSWIMCASSAGSALLLFIICMCIDVRDGQRSRSGYMVMLDRMYFDNTLTGSDDEPLIDI